MPFAPSNIGPGSGPGSGAGARAISGMLGRAIEECRQGHWDQGLPYLGLLADSEDRSSLPGLFYSYLGYGIALREQRLEEGLKLCRHAIKIEFFQPENYLNLARTLLLANDRRGAVKAVREGLKIDPKNEEILALQKDMGKRRPPVLSFLSRDHPLNRLFGSVRHKLTGG